MRNRTLVGTSHDATYQYWLDTSDRYIYQFNALTQEWIGWLCAQSVWEKGFGSHAAHDNMPGSDTFGAIIETW